MQFPFASIRRSKTVYTIAIFATGNTVAMLLGVVGSFVQARYVGPEEMGIFRTFGIVVSYLTFFHLGVFDGLQREIPLQLGRGNAAKAEQAASACLAWITLISLICGIVFIGLALQAAYCRKWMQFWGWLAFTPGIVVTFYGGYLGTTFRTGQQFIKLSKASVIQAVAGTVVLPLMPILGYYGACLRAAATSVTNIFFLHRWRPMKLRPRFYWPDFWEVIRMGLPLSSIGYVATSLWVAVEGTLVLNWFGLESLGLFSMAVFVRSVVSQMVQNANQVMGVKIYEQYGRSGKVIDCVHLILKPMALAFFASLPLIVVGWFALPWAVNLLIPKYVGAISMMQVVLLAMPLTLLNLPMTILWATGRRIDCFVGTILGFLAFLGISLLFYRMNIGVLGIFIASMIGQMINILVSYMMILRLALRRNESLFSDEEELSYSSHI